MNSRKPRNVSVMPASHATSQPASQSPNQSPNQPTYRGLGRYEVEEARLGGNPGVETLNVYGILNGNWWMEEKKENFSEKDKIRNAVLASGNSSGKTEYSTH